MDEDDMTPLEELLEDLKAIDGFPEGDDEDILELSDPPYYTACPNPYIEEFIEKHGTEYDPEGDDYEKKPFVSDVSEGKNNPIYNVHTFHTKVPHKAIEEYINHYTSPGDIVFDGFSGSGMTGIASQLTGRNAILTDLSPITTFLSHNYNNSSKLEKFKKHASEILSEFRQELGWMYETNPKTRQTDLMENKKKAMINYVVWVDRLVCPYCEETIDKYKSTTEEKILGEREECPNCEANIDDDFKRHYNDVFDPILEKDIKQATQNPIIIEYETNEKKEKKLVEPGDEKLIKEINEKEIPYWYPVNELPEGKNTNQPKNSHNFTHIHHLYTKRNLWSSAYIFHKIDEIDDLEVKNLLKFWFTSVCIGQTKLNRYFESSYSQVNRYLKGKLYVSGKTTEVNPNYSFSGKIDKISKYLDFKKENVIVGTNSATDLNIPDNSIDYIFTDPPYGGNIMYSEANFIWENWLKVRTNNKKEAIVNEYQNKDTKDYERLMHEAFEEFFRILKPNRWITLVFHNSKAKVWNAIREALSRSGFIVAQVNTMDKQQETFKQMTAPGSVKNDLIINAYKPKKEFSKRFFKKSGEGMEIDFVRQQLEHLPVKPNIERTEKMLYSKMLAHYVENGFKVQYDSTEFYDLLKENFVELDGYWFVEDQVEEYNEWKSQLSVEELKETYDEQQKLLVTDEKSALNWLNNFLKEPKEYNKIYTAFQQVLTQSDDKMPELKELLENNFIFEDGKYRRPQTEEEKKKVQKSRRKELDKEFKKIVKEAREGSTKIKNVRKEALIHGFTKWYQDERYEGILEVADRLYKSTLESSGDIMDFVDIAEMKTSNKKNIEDY